MKKNQSSALSFTLGSPALIWQVLFFYLPLFLTIGTSFCVFSDAGELLGITGKKLFSFFHPLYLRVIASSLLLSITNSLLCFLLAYPLAYFLAFRSPRKKNFFLFLLIVPFWTNFLLHVYAWFFVLEKEGVINQLLQLLGCISQPLPLMNSLFATMLMMLYHYLPFMVLPIYASLEKFDRRLMEASFDLGGSFLTTLRRIILPLSLPGIRAGFFLVYIPSFGEFAIPEFMGGDKHMFVGNVIARFILGDQTGSLGAAFTVVSCALLLASAIVFYFLLGKLILPKAETYAS